MIIKHRPGSANGVTDVLSQPPGTNEGSQDNQNVVVLPPHLFYQAMSTFDLRFLIQMKQQEHQMEIQA
jgi:hypothetical protein